MDWKGRLRALGFRKYEDYLKSPHWKLFSACEKRRTCYCCGRRGRLQLHHVTYDRLGRERPGDVVTLCGRCHKACHVLIRRRRATLADAHEKVRRWLDSAR